MSWFDAYSLRFSGFTPNQRAYLQPGYRSQHFTYWRPSGGAQQTPLLALLDIELQDYLPEYVLRKADLCAMAHGLELGAPLLDHAWYQNLLAMPAKQRFATPAKVLFKDACPPREAFGLFPKKEARV